MIIHINTICLNSRSIHLCTFLCAWMNEWVSISNIEKKKSQAYGKEKGFSWRQLHTKHIPQIIPLLRTLLWCRNVHQHNAILKNLVFKNSYSILVESFYAYGVFQSLKRFTDLYGDCDIWLIQFKESESQYCPWFF